MTGDPRTVLIVNPGSDLYGSDRVLLESVKALVAAEHRVVVTVPGDGPLVAHLRDCGASVVQHQTPVLRKGLLSPRGLIRLGAETCSSLLPSRRLLRATNAATVMVNTLTAPMWLLLARVSRRTVVCHVHEAESNTPALVRRLLYIPLIFSHRIVANSRFTLEVLARSARWLRRRTAVVHNAVPGPSEVVPAREDLAGSIRLLYFGRLSARKGPHVVVDALRILKGRGVDARLTILGDVFPGNEDYEVSLRKKVRDADLEDSVRWLGFQSEVWPFLADCDIALVPSTGDESFGNAAVEASLAGRPVIVSDIPGLREASEGAHARLTVPAGDTEAVASAVATIAEDWSRYRQLAAVDSRNAARTFSRENYARGLLAAMGLTTPGAQ